MHTHHIFKAQTPQKIVELCCVASTSREQFRANRVCHRRLHRALSPKCCELSAAAQERLPEVGMSSLIIPRWRGSSLPGRYKLGTWPVPPMKTIVLLADRLRRRLSEEHRTRRSDNSRTFGNNKWLGRILRGRLRIKALDGKLAWTLRSTGELRDTGTTDTLRHSGTFLKVF